MSPQRNQVSLQAPDLDSLLAQDQSARTVWAFVQSMDPAPLYARIRPVAGRGGAPAIDPAILVALWLWATIDGVGSACELIDRVRARRRLPLAVRRRGVNYHSLADMRAEHEAWLDAQLTRSTSALLSRRVVTLNAVMQGGLRVRARSKTSSFRRRKKLAELHAHAQTQVLVAQGRTRRGCRCKHAAQAGVRVELRRGHPNLEAFGAFVEEVFGPQQARFPSG